MGPPRSPDGLVVGGYRLEEPLGRGGAGQVFRAREEGGEGIVALKLLRDPRALALLERAMAVRHPHLVRILAAGTAPVGAYVVMEALEGTSLRDVLERRGRLDVATAVAVLLPVLDALHCAHARGLVHGDLKPENVFLERRGGPDVRVKVLDLGGIPPVAMDDAVFGSAGYLSPEQASGEALDPRSDVFGAGLLLFELVTGHSPFPETQPVAAAYAVVHRPALLVGDPRLQPVLDAALAKAPTDRFPDAAAFALALAHLAPDADVSAAALSALGTP